MAKEKKPLQDLFDSMDDHAEIRYVRENLIVIGWSAKGTGFGEYTFRKKEDKWILDSECMSRDSVKKILGILVDKTPLVDEE